MKSKKYSDITSAARELFWKHGFRRISIEEICVRANVSKMTFYRFFPNKIELAKIVFDEVVDNGIQRFKSIMNDDTSAAEKLKNILLMKLEGTNDISREFIQDFYGKSEPGLSMHIEEKTRTSWNEINTDFKIAQSNGIFRSDIKPEFIILISRKLGEIINEESALELYDTPQELVMEMANFFTYGIASHK